MNDSIWKTGAPKTRAHVTLPTARHALAQVGIALAVVAVWGAGLAGCMSVAKLPMSAASVATAAPTFAPTVAPTTSAPTPKATEAPAVNPTKPAPTATTAATAAPPTPTQAAAVNPSGAVSYAKDVQPLLTRVCVKCHGGEQTEGGFVAKTYADVMKGSENGEMVVPGKSAASTLIALLNEGKMPKKGPKLLPGEIRILTQWVDAGAPNN